jgi:hypothetical protein
MLHDVVSSATKGCGGYGDLEAGNVGFSDARCWGVLDVVWSSSVLGVFWNAK